MTAITVVFTAQVYKGGVEGVEKMWKLTKKKKEVIVFLFFLVCVSESQAEQYVMNILCIISYCGLNSIKPNYGNLLNQFEKARDWKNEIFLR